MKKLNDTIRRLTEFEHFRHRTNMWLGSVSLHTAQVMLYDLEGKPFVKEITYVPAMFTAFREILDNSVDEIISHKAGNTIKVTYDEDKKLFSVEDLGRGIPIDLDKESKLYQATIAITQPRVGRNFEEREGNIGINGVGAACTCAVSAFMDLTIHRDGKIFEQHFNEGNGKNKDLIIEKPRIFPTKKGTQTGTKIVFQLSKTVFKDQQLPEEFIRSRIQEVAICYPNLILYYNGKKIQIKDTEKTLFPDHKPIIFNIDSEGLISKFWLVPMFFENKQEFTHSMVNCIPAFSGGTHIDAFKRSFFSNLLNALTPLSKKKKLTPNRSDITDGLLIYNISQVKDAQFDSQSKSKLTNPEVGKIIKAEMDNPEFFKKIIKTHPEWIEDIYKRCAERTQKNDADDLKKLTKKKRTKVEKLIDACGRDRSKTSLTICEGDSALTGLIESRIPEIHGAMPLRGKILNVHGHTLKKIAENDILQDLMNAIGLSLGKKAERKNLNYGSIMIATDADYDGYSIAALTINFFYTIWPELFDPKQKPYIYIFQTPLIIAKKNKLAKYWYADNVHSFNPETYKNWEITRAKGLAALKKEDWDYCLKEPKLEAIVDDGKLKEVLDMIFNEERANDRKNWLSISN